MSLSLSLYQAWHVRVCLSLSLLVYSPYINILTANVLMSSGTSPQAIRASTNYRECPCPKGPPVTPRNLSGAVQRLSSQPQCFSRRLLCLNRESIEKVTASKHKAGCLKEANHVKLATKACILCHSTSRCKTPTDFDGKRVDGETVFW